MSEMWDILGEDGEPTGVLKERGPLGAGEYHLVVHVWIMNGRGELLVSKRTPNKPWPLMWETTGGSAVAGQDSLAAALAEAREELGIALRPENGRVYRRFTIEYAAGNGDIVDVWLFEQDVDLGDVVLSPEETCDAMLATPQKILKMMDGGQFISREFYPYIDEFFAEIKRRQHNGR